MVEQLWTTTGLDHDHDHVRTATLQCVQLYLVEGLVPGQVAEYDQGRLTPRGNATEAKDPLGIDVGVDEGKVLNSVTGKRDSGYGIWMHMISVLD